MEEKRIGSRGQNGAHRVALLQNAGEDASALGGQGLEDQRRAHAPLAAHRQAKGARSPSSAPSEGAKPQASSIAEKLRMFAISTGRRP